MKRFPIHPFFSLMVLLLVAGFAGCAKEEVPTGPIVKKPVPKVVAKAAPPVAEKAQPAAAGEAPRDNAVVLYDPSGKRDPFIPFLKAETKTASTRNNLDSLPPLQRYDVGELKYMGVIVERKGYRALVEDGEGRGYSVMVGTKIGRSGGVVTSITFREIVIKEEFRDYTGARKHQEISLKLQNAGGK